MQARGIGIVRVLAGAAALAVQARAEASAAAEPPADVGALLRDAQLWSAPAAEFMDRYEALGLEWVAPDQTARSASPLVCDGRRVWELLVRFSEDRPVEVTLSFYNRGDAGDLSSGAFQDLLDGIQRGLTAWAGTPVQPAREARGPARTRVYSMAWSRAPHQATLEWDAGPARSGAGDRAFRAEYIRLRLAPGDAPAAVSILNAAALRRRVRRDPGGDVELPDVPMVDQGQKGYCAAAVTERVLRYYGFAMDQHQVARLADTSSDAGTSHDQLEAAVRRLAVWLKLNFRTYQDLDLDGILRLIADYNRVAERAGKPALTHGPVIFLAELYGQMDAECLARARARRPADRQRFLAQVAEQIDAGVPLLWSVVLGLVPEQPALPQADGGHLRLIIGYNRRTGEVLYSDSWGAAHALKRMPLADAWTITIGLYALVPRNLT